MDSPPHVRFTAILAAVAFMVTAGLRLVRLGPSADVFVDEIIYRDVGHSAALGGFPQADNGPFFLHPPAFFYLEAGWEQVFRYRSDPVADVDSMRILNVLLAAGTAALLVVLVMRVTRSRVAAVVAVALFALDPYSIRQNDRVMLETSVMFWVVAGFLVLVPLTRRPPPARARIRACCAGLLFGLAVLTKDQAALLTLLPLAIAFVLNWAPGRRLLLQTSAAAVAPYLGYAVVVAATGHFAAFWEAKTSGFGRLIGAVQDSGFNAPGAPPLSSRLTAEMSDFGPTYALLAFGPVALWLLLRRGGPAERLLGLLYGCAALTLAYALAGGTLEEQALYLLVVPTMIALAVALPLAAAGLAGRPAMSRRMRTVGAVLLTVSLLTSCVSYATIRSQTDSGYARLLAYMAVHVPRGSAVTAFDGGSQPGITYWALRGQYRVGIWVTDGQRVQEGVHYLVIPWKVISQGYGDIGPAQAQALAGQGRLLFSTAGSTYGTLALYALPLPGAAPGRLAPASSAASHAG
ncbi:phospholipid carrier-dependent glycosyltransferase [Streptacidiphilus sp. EB129]|uniref:phospholipid carrier-dependent glycosyltransferase n=1 Tax=Streptacidiphilus sp. EB129 TaxID=3156262 RepID=UPI003519CA7A